MNRALRAATTAALLLSPIALTACGAGQVSQTTGQVRDRVGPVVDAGTISLRTVLLEYPTGGRYEAGDDAELQAAIVNSGDEADRLVAIESDAFEGVRVLGSDEASELDIEIPRNEAVFLGEGDAPTVLLENLEQDLTTGQGIDLTMTFEQAGDVRVHALVNVPGRDLDRPEPFDFHHEEEGEAEGGSAE